MLDNILDYIEKTYLNHNTTKKSVDRANCAQILYDLLVENYNSFISISDTLYGFHMDLIDYSNRVINEFYGIPYDDIADSMLVINSVIRFYESLVYYDSKGEQT